MTRPALALIALLAGACSETVGFLSLELETPSRSPELICAQDPRRAETLEVALTCAEQQLRRVFSLSASSVSMGDVPLGSCTVTISARNAYQRTVLSGSLLATIERGENAPLTVSLVEERCEDAACDPDGDGLATHDEEALGTDPERADSDGDGLDDGIELLQCCSDPLRPDHGACKLVIAAVEPSIGPANESVMIKATASLRQPQVQLGLAPLEGPLADETVVFGRVSPRAVLGPIELQSEGVTAQFRDLFAVLHQDPEPVSELDQKAGGKLRLMQQLVDLGQRGTQLFLLGTAADGTPVLIEEDQRTKISTRLLLQSQGGEALGRPVALAVGETRAVVLLAGPAQNTLLAVIELPSGQPLDAQAVRVQQLALPDPVALVLEPGEQTLQLLWRDKLMRSPLEAAGSGALIEISRLLPPPPGGAAAAGQEISCTGLAFLPQESPEQAATVAACNLPAPFCPAGEVCETRSTLLQIMPVGSCLPLSGSPPDLASSSCYQQYLGKGFERAVGLPVVDASRRLAFQLTTAGLVGIELKTPGPGTLPTLPLSLIVPLQTLVSPSALRPLALDGAGRLFLADGPRVWRMEPFEVDPLRRQGKPFVIGQGLQGHLLSLAPDGTTLAVGRRREGGIDSLAEICLHRCPGCLCE